MRERMQEKRYWKIQTASSLTKNEIPNINSTIVCAETEESAIAIATSKLQLKYTIIQIRKVEEIEPITYIIEYIDKKTEHIGDIYGMVICLIVFIVIINIVELFVKV